MTNDELKALVAEDFFYESLKNSKSLGGIKFDYVEKNIKGRDGNLEGQYDIVIYNGDAIGIVEVKYKATVAHIQKIKNKQIEAFKKIFPQYKNHKFYGAIATMTLSKESENIALNNGFFVLKQLGEGIKTIVRKEKIY